MKVIISDLNVNHSAKKIFLFTENNTALFVKDESESVKSSEEDEERRKSKLYK